VELAAHVRHKDRARPAIVCGEVLRAPHTRSAGGEGEKLEAGLIVLVDGRAEPGVPVGDDHSQLLWPHIGAGHC
jgi:hypothetical protein